MPLPIPAPGHYSTRRSRRDTLAAVRHTRPGPMRNGADRVRADAIRPRILRRIADDRSEFLAMTGPRILLGRVPVWDQ